MRELGEKISLNGVDPEQRGPRKGLIGKLIGALVAAKELFIGPKTRKELTRKPKDKRNASAWFDL